MRQQTPGKIFLAEERGVAESDRFRRFSTFNFGAFARAHQGPFGPLYGFNEETLAARHALDFEVTEASHVLLIPITGAVALSGAGLAEATISVEETLVLAVPAGGVLRLQNPFDEELVSFLHVWLRAAAPVAAISAQRAEFSLEARPNELLPVRVGSTGPVALSLGRFAGRREAIYRLTNPNSSFFAFVLAGAFEVEGRLLHEKDGLALWDAAEIELEALSNDAIVVVLELPPAGA